VKSWILNTVIILFTMCCMVIPAAASVSFSSSAPQIITIGDTFSISGTDAMNGPIAIWIFGRDYFDVKTAIPDRNGNYSLVIKSDETREFSSGKYAVVIQDPGPDGKMQIEPGRSGSGNITVLNRGRKIADIGPQEDIQANVEPVVAILEAGAGLQGVDDIFVSDYFFVEEPTVTFDQIAGNGELPAQATGNRIIFNGSTNIGLENSLDAVVRDLGTNTLVLTKTIPISTGTDTNRWSYDLQSPGLPEGRYSLTIGWTKSNVTGTGYAYFSVENAGRVTEPPGPITTPGSKQGEELPLPLIITGALAIVIIIILFTTQRR
jgi:hypothetical protein